jgi:hypothetical protein
LVVDNALLRLLKPCPSVKYRVHSTFGITSLTTTTSSAPVELRVLIFCLEDRLKTTPFPRDKTVPV